MIKDERKKYLLEKTNEFIKYLNTIIGAEEDKIMGQREFAHLIGCANSTVSRWLNKEHPMSIETAYKICDILNIDKNEYLNNDMIICDTNFINLNQNVNFNNLSKENKNKVYEYIDYLLYKQNEVSKQKVKRKEI